MACQHRHLADGQLTHGFRLRFLHQSHGAAASTQKHGGAEGTGGALATDELRLYPSADDGLPHRWDCDTADVLYWDRCRGAIQAGPDVPAIPTIARKSPQIPNFRELLLCC